MVGCWRVRQYTIVPTPPFLEMKICFLICHCSFYLNDTSDSYFKVYFKERLKASTYVGVWGIVPKH